MNRYGRGGCEHDWVYRKGGWEEQCVPAICRECGAFGCQCDIPDPKPPKDSFFGNAVNSTDDNGRWVNPYIKIKDGDLRNVLQEEK